MCFICQSKTNQKLVRNQSLITQIFINEGIVIPNGNRICKDNLTKTRYLDENSIEVLRIKANEKLIDLNAENIVELLNDLGSRAKNGITNGNSNFDENSLSNQDSYYLIGIYKDQFDYLLSFINVTRYKYPLVRICPNHICPNHICPNHICPNHICPNHICPNTST